MTRVLKRRAIVVIIFVAAISGGCGGRGAHVFTGADARRLASLAPSGNGWRWPQNEVKPIWDTSTGAPTSDRLLARYRRKTASLRALGEAAKKWQDTDKLANLVVDVYKTSPAAHAVMAPFNALSEGLAARSGRIRKAARTNHLGEEAWVMWVNGNGAQVSYHWRRDNLVFETHIHCFGNCPANIDAATRTWAETIDAAARALR